MFGEDIAGTNFKPVGRGSFAYAGVSEDMKKAGILLK